MKNLKFALLAVFVLGGNIVFSAPPPPPSGGPGCWPPPCVPVDNGLIFLISAGVILVAKKLYDAHKKSSLIS